MDMAKSMRIVLLVLLCLIAAAAIAFIAFRLYVKATTKVTVYPAPAGEPSAKGYRVEVNGKPLFLYNGYAADTNGGNYAFASFDFKGEAVVRITADRDLKNAAVLPAAAGVRTSVDGKTMTITMTKPCRISVEPGQKDNPLLLFANPIEKNVPKQGAPDVIYYGPGIHKPGVIKLTSNQTLYLAGGAVVKGGVEASGDNIKIEGRGILDGSDWPHSQGPCGDLIDLVECHHVSVEGVTLRGCWGWTTRLLGSEHVSFENMKIVAGRVQNDDGIDPCNSRDVTIHDCFIRTDDDCIAVKGVDRKYGDVENISISDCTFWGDRARIMLLGHESRATYMRNITVNNCDIIHYVMTPFLCEPGEEMTLENLLVENVRVRHEDQTDLITLYPTINQYMVTQVPGRIKDCIFRNITVTNTPGSDSVPLIWIEGYDASHDVKNITFDHIVMNGKVVGPKSPGVNQSGFISGITFR